MGNIYIFVFIALIIFILGGFFYFIKKIEKIQKSHQEQQEQKWQMAIDLLKRGLDEKLDRTTSEMYRQLRDHAKTQAQVYAQLSKELGVFQEIGREMKNLQEVLRSPKLRGNLGEQVLRDLLEQIFPRSSFSCPYKFNSNQTEVDAIIKTKQGIIPIDSKFPMESFQRMHKAKDEREREIHLRDFRRDIKKHIDDIAKKYILPEEGTVDFAVMYIPSELIYYELVAKNDDLLHYGYNKKVYFVSPNNFYYFLKVVMIGLEGARIEELTKRIWNGLKAIQQERDKFSEELGVLLTHISRTKSASEKVSNRYSRLSSSIDNISMIEIKDKKGEVESKKKEIRSTESET